MSLGTEPPRLDLDDLLAALHTLSAELDVDRIVENLVDIALRSAGARRGAVVTHKDGSWETYDPRRDHDAVEGEILPWSIIRHAYRTRDTVVLDDATRGELFARDPYVRRRTRLSVVAIPLVSPRESVGVLYLENDRATGVFSKDRQATLQALAAQATIALHNARLFASREDLTRRLGVILETVGDGVMTVDRDQVIRMVNREVERIFGYARAELVGRPLSTIMPKKHRARHNAAFTKRLSSSKPMERRYVEVEGLRKGGEIFPLELRFSEAEVAGQKLFISALRDITARLQDRARIEELSAALRRERDYLRQEVRESGQFGEIVGRSPALQSVLTQLNAVAETDATVLIEGESGVGKELLARAIHERSPRHEKPLVRVNCASVPKELFESEFFGHVRGAFTGAHQAREGRFALADGGTIFLDEIGEVPLALQSKLLRVLQEHEFERVGEARTRKVDVRVVAATNRNLLAEVERGEFRQDLYYRLSVFPLRAPPLRERKEDIFLLADHFLRRSAAKLNVPPAELSPAAESTMRAYPWPGNIRELQNVMERASILARGGTIQLGMLGLPDASPEPSPSRAPPVPEANRPNSSRRERAKLLTKEEILAALALHDGVIRKVAADLGISRQALYRRMRKLGLGTGQDG